MRVPSDLDVSDLELYDYWLTLTPRDRFNFEATLDVHQKNLLFAGAVVKHYVDEHREELDAMIKRGTDEAFAALEKTYGPVDREAALAIANVLLERMNDESKEAAQESLRRAVEMLA